jgi:hypothetical protein
MSLLLACLFVLRVVCLQDVMKTKRVFCLFIQKQISKIFDQ